MSLSCGGMQAAAQQATDQAVQLKPINVNGQGSSNVPDVTSDYKTNRKRFAETLLASA
jgi:hypothetical protein